MSNYIPYEKEVDLCNDFIEHVTADGNWIIYPETCGYDILLVRKSDGFQIAIEAKLRLNVKVLSQILPSGWNLKHNAVSKGPDCYAIIVPQQTKLNDIENIASFLGVTVVRVGRMKSISTRTRPYFINVNPHLPIMHSKYDTKDWQEWAPVERLPLPDYIPDVIAGGASPQPLTHWKIKAIKLSLILKKRPVTRADFKALDLSPTLWLNARNGWLKRSDNGYIATSRVPDFKTQHPVNYKEIKSDMRNWYVDGKPVERKATNS